MGITKQAGFQDIDAYIKAALPEGRIFLKEIRKIIRATVPKAEETIGYQMPAFRLKRNFIYFAAFKGHIGIYPPLTKNQSLIKALSPYRGPKGNLKFPFSEPMPYTLIGKIALALAKEYSA